MSVSRRENLLGRRFGKLTVISIAENKNGRTMWKCRCDCGKIKEVETGNLKRGNSKSCGCSRADYLRDVMLGTKGRHTTHGLRNTRLYSIWASISIRRSLREKDVSMAQRSPEADSTKRDSSTGKSVFQKRSINAEMVCGFVESPERRAREAEKQNVSGHRASDGGSMGRR